MVTDFIKTQVSLFERDPKENENAQYKLVENVHTCEKELVSSVDNKFLQLSNKKIISPLNMGRRFKQTFHKEGLNMTTKHIKRCLITRKCYSKFNKPQCILLYNHKNV